jgi:dihydroxyacetone kinase
MRKLINAPERFVDEMLEGIYAAHPDQVTFTNGDLRCYVRKTRREGKVALATGGGSGHLPVFMGYVGKGLADGCSIGAAPSAMSSPPQAPTRCWRPRGRPMGEQGSSTSSATIRATS